MKNYFKDCKTIDEAKNLFRRLCLELHPDKGGNDADFILMYSQFKNFRPTAGPDHTKDNFNAEKFYNMVKLFEGLEGVNISFVGSFIWLEGNTMLNKDKIKSIKIEGYKPANWAKVKKCWFFSPEDYKQKSRSTKDLEQLKSEYGCRTFKANEFYKLAY